MDYPEQLCYSRRHLWASVDEARSVATIGMTEDLVEGLGEITSIDLPMVGDELDMDTFCIHVHLDARLRHLRSPLSGRVVEINRDVLDRASLLHTAPYEHWLYRMEFDEPDELDLLMDASQYIKYVDRL